MSLIKCPNCKATVSDKATVCPKCGKTTQYSTKSAKIAIWIFVIFFGLSGVCIVYDKFFKFSTVSLATKNAQYHSFICKADAEGDHKITLYDNTFYYEVKMHYADEWLRVAKGTYEVKEFTSNKKKKIGVFVRVEQKPDISFLVIDLSEMNLYWAEQYIGKVEIE
ncbi:zinc ribbon domain-containing protein [Bacteroides thetaiotaomicron]|uniref:zinc ribbon domain-containing protein n=1 Tax=Bacteroides thetaiotaomicron TaxID=818 RepID=UPI00089FAD5D|nr:MULTISPECIES: zinc ribbon domain-containing protein [Bacteroides]MBS5448684.1 zinc ribbon domain-containing protein [Bacteroides thetaiotaomicron]MBV4338230.1 zinc ribbon domain-containing protein [Bacteroides thetaiotaomicron]MBV4374617.1 zinc ribbon domain-containing protein [Bacteroides thetaiotaomicron]MBV4379968.1 zinc ribbon domain-containing protein [Bacteroides thetaiotaomicron]MCB6319490.1 zinc ribbon domain-containing protein [Bacteroides thetaiotaomicron]